MNEKFTFKKFGIGVLGFVAGIVCAPIVIVATPFFLAWFLYSEED